MVYVFSGARDSGKTSRMASYYNLVPECRRGDGILSRKVFSGGDCIGYDFQQCSTEISVPGLRLKDSVPAGWQQEWPIGKFSISTNGFDFASSVLRQCINSSCPAVWIDEIGRLELSESGFYGLLSSALKQEIPVYLCCRDDIIDLVLERFCIRNYQIIAC